MRNNKKIMESNGFLLYKKYIHNMEQIKLRVVNVFGVQFKDFQNGKVHSTNFDTGKSK